MLSCETTTGGKISASYALYGRRVDSYCPYQGDPTHQANRNTGCDTSAASDLVKVKKRCDGLTLCDIGGKPAGFIADDPCYGTSKYIRVRYSCVDDEGVVVSDPISSRIGKFMFHIRESKPTRGIKKF